MGCYSNNFALRKKVYYLFSVYSLHRCENSCVYRMHNTSILSVDVKTNITKVKISVFGGLVLNVTTCNLCCDAMWYQCFRLTGCSMFRHHEQVSLKEWCHSADHNSEGCALYL